MAPAIYIAKSGAKNAPTLPADAVTRTFGIFGMKDSGKTTAARVLVEGVCKIGGHAVVVDPVGVWWGATRAGSGPGIKGVVIGGEHGDVPLEETGGKLVAELVLAQQYPLVVIDTNLLRKAARHRFLADLLEEVYHRNRRPLMVVFEEADQTLPQAPKSMDPTLGRVLGAAEDIVKLGRSRGLGAALISQRFATVNKNVTEQIESLILLRIIGPNDRKAVKAWIESNGEADVTAKVMDSMAKLHQGEGWLYSPGWLRLLEKVRLRASRTLDSSATPTDEEAIQQDAATRAPVSLDDLRSQMAETIERAKENDPTELRKRVVELERELKKLRDAPAPEPEAAEPQLVYPWTDEEFERAMQDAQDAMSEADDARQVVEGVVEHVADARKHVEQLLGAMRTWRERKDNEIATLDKLIVKATGNRIAPGAGVLPSEVAAGAMRKAGLTPPGGKSHSTGARPVTPMQSPPRQLTDGLSGVEQKVLDALAWWAEIGVAQPSKGQVGFIAGYRVGKKVGGTYGNLLGKLRAAGLVDYPSAGAVVLTDAGRKLAWPADIERTDAGLQQAVYERLAGTERRVLEVIVDAYPAELHKRDVGAAAGYTVGEKVGGTFGNILGKLRTLGLIDYPSTGYVRAAPVMFIR